MINGLATAKVVVVTPPGAIVDNASYTTAEVDRKGFNRIVFMVTLGATDIALAAFKLRESATSGSGMADVSGADFSVSPATLPSATDDNLVYYIHVDGRGRQRYLDLTLTGGDGSAGTYATVHAFLEEPEIVPSTAVQRGVAQELFV